MAITRQKPLREEKFGSQAKANWSHDDEVELLAWLDYKHGTAKTADLQISSFLIHLRNCRRKEFTVPQIQRKIKSLWTANNHPTATSLDEIYASGTKCLPRLSSDFKKEANERLGTLKDEALAKRLESPRQLRSASRSADSELSRHISLGVEIAETPSPRKRKLEKFGSNAAIDASRSRKRGGAVDQLAPYSNGWWGRKRPIEENEAQTKGPNFVIQVIMDSEDELTGGDGRDSPTTRVYKEEGNSPSTVDVSQIAQEEKTEYSEESRSAEKQQTVDPDDLGKDPLSFEGPHEELEEAQIEQSETICSLRRELSVVQRDCEELQRKLDLRDHTNQVLSQADKSILERLCESDEEISGLKEALGNKVWLRAFSTLSSKDPMPVEAGKVQAGMAFIDDNIKHLLLYYQDDGFCTTPSFEGRHELNSLFRRSFPVGFSADLSSISEASDWSDFTLHAILRTLIASAICEWVFESDLPNISETPCALLKKYRLHLGLQDGEITLKNLDFAAHASLIEDEFFQRHVIPARASVLADRVIRTLAPLFIQPERPEDLDDEVISAWSAKKFLLREIFESALKIKAQATISKDLFEMILYSPGTTFDEDIMILETMDGGPAQTPPSITPPRVKLCLLPSLYVYEHDRKMVDPNNFIRRPNGQRSDAIKLTKAVVVLENAQPIP